MRAPRFALSMLFSRVLAALVAPALVWPVLLSPALVSAAETPLPQAWDYSQAMRAVAARFQGREGVVLHVGDSITYANPYGAWARYGAGRSADELTLLRWMHAGADDNTDGWWLARFDLPGGRSHTACSGLRADELLAGGKAKLPAFEKLLDDYRPRFVVLMIGTNDVSANRKPVDFAADLTKAIDLMLARGVVPIVSTIPPHIGRPELGCSFNDAIRAQAKAKSLPLIDYEAEILLRRPTDWDGTLLGKGDVHPTAEHGGATPASEPTAEHLRNSGYLLRGWLTVQKIGEVKRTVLDGQPLAGAPANTPVAATPADSAAPDRAPSDAKPASETIKVPVTRDTYFSNVGPEIDGNLGGAPKLKVKSIQEMSLIDIDPQPLRGRKIEAATLHLHGKDLKRITVSSFASPWVEGTANGYQPQKGSSSFRSAQHPSVPWTKAGGDLCAVMLGQGGTVWRMADATPVDTAGWQHVPVDPVVLAARVAELSYGLLVFDDTGSEWTRDGEKFTLHVFPNRFFASRESDAATAPYLIVTLGAVDDQPPAKASGFEIDADELPAGEVRVSWLTPPDAGAAGTLGFIIGIEGRPAARDMIPPAGKPGERVTMHLRDLPIKPGERMSVKAVDAAGNVGPEAVFVLKNVSTHQPKQLPQATASETAASAPTANKGAPASLPRLGQCEIAIIDALDKVQPVSGAMIPPQPAEYLASNPLWNAARREIRLAGAKNEFVDFQILLRGKARGVQARLVLADSKPGTPKVAFGRYAHVASAKGPLPDPIVPLDAPLDIPTPAEHIDGQQSASLLCEVYIPHDAPAGKQTATLRLQSADGALDLPVTLTIWDFTLPNTLSFLPEMNCYGLPENERAYYRLAQAHRTVLNRVPYHHSGGVDDGCAPAINGKQLDWTKWDERFGPLFDGSAFADSPRGPTPIECFYLPIFENWPSPMAAAYNSDYWAEKAFPPAYRAALVDVSRQFADHFGEREWQETLFHFFLNGKNNFKANGWSRGTCPWLLDEPANFQDYWALRWFGEAFHEGVRQSSGKAKLLYRCDISRPQWQRDTLDGVLDYNVVGGGAFRQYHRMVLDRRRQFGQIVLDYGGSNAVEQSNMQPVGWSIDSWSLESDGILPWQTIGNADSWKKANAESLFYPAPAGSASGAGGGDPIPSIRLKAYRRGQQDIEYLTLLTRQMHEPRWSVGRQIRETLNLSGRREGTGFVGGEDAGMIAFADLTPQAMTELRRRVGSVLSAAHPPALARLVEFRTPPRDGKPRMPSYVAGFAGGGGGASGIASGAAAADSPSAAEDGRPTTGQKPPATGAAAANKAAANTIVLQGRGAVADVLIDFAAPEKSLGAEPRNNALRRADQCNAFLLRFDLSKAQPPRDARLRRATLSFFVWDPSSQGNTKVVAARVKTHWDEATATWERPTAAGKWRGRAFDPNLDTADLSAAVVVAPDQGADTSDPPLEYQLNVTEIARAWLAGSTPNDGLALLPVIDRMVDEGYHTRFQMFASEHGAVKITPKLVLDFERP